MASTERPEGVDLSRDPKAPEMSLGQLFSDMTSNLSTLMRKEVELAKVETKEEVSRAGKAGAMLATGGLLAYLALLLASFALAWLLDDVMHRALAFLVVAVLHAIVAAVLVSKGRQRIKELQPMTQTMETLKEDVEWARAQRS